MEFLLCALFLGSIIAGHEAAASRVQPDAPTLIQQYPFYHTSQQFSENLISLLKHCPYATVKKEPVQDGNGTRGYINVVSIRQGENPSTRFFMLAGEHARELISAESAFHFIRVLCGQEKKLAIDAKDVLRNTQFRIIFNGNPLSRQRVESGEYCLRVNENGVDLNRNWADHWNDEPIGNADTNPGSKPFSEQEVRVFQKVLSEYKPHVFLSVHSGTLGMYTPYAYSTDEPPRNEKKMLNILKTLDEEFCQCPFGELWKQIGAARIPSAKPLYRKGSERSWDYAYDKLKVPFAYAFEIFTSRDREDDIRQLWKKALQATMVSRENLKNPYLRNIFSRYPSEFVGLKKSTRKLRTSEGIMNPEMLETACFKQFNPIDATHFDSTLLNWSMAYLKLAKETVEARATIS